MEILPPANGHANGRSIPENWVKWCSAGKSARKKNALRRSLVNGNVRGYFSDIPLNPELEHSHSMYPSVEHLVSANNHQEIVVEARIVNDMKSHLSEDEFWKMVEHLFSVGIKKGKIKAPFGKRLPKGWTPARHYIKATAPSGDTNGKKLLAFSGT